VKKRKKKKVKRLIYFNRKPKSQESYEPPSPIPQQEEVDELDAHYKMHLEIMESAAIFIQKNYRGYRTRKIVREHLR